ncbi:MAG: glycosyltransferase [Aquisalimonadaceae bacterium]
MNPDMPISASMRGDSPYSITRQIAKALTAHAGSGEQRGPRRVLLFTSSLGFGHLRAAQAIELALKDRMPLIEVRTLDLWSLMDEKVALAIRTAYLRLVQEQPDLYDRVYRLDQRTWRAILQDSKRLPPEIAEIMALIPVTLPNGKSARAGNLHAMDRILLVLLTTVLSAHPNNSLANSRLLRLALVQSAWARLSRRFINVIQGFDPDVVIATQMNPAALLSAARTRGCLDIPTIGVVTDYGVHDFWMQSGIDLYCLAHQSMAEPDTARITADKVVSTGIPLMPGFRQPPDVHEARRALGLATDRPTVLVAGGGLGLGVDAVAERLLTRSGDSQLLINSGRNPTARRALALLARRYPDRLRVWNWTEHMEQLICAADVVIGKPGGLTVAETLACGRPLLATHALQGQEGFNIRFLESHGAGRMVPEDQLVGALDALFRDPLALMRMKARAWSLGRRDGAARIAALVERSTSWYPHLLAAGA